MTLPHKSLLMAWATRGRHQLGMSTAGPRSPKEPRMPVRLRWCFCQTGQAVTDCVSLCQPELVYVRPRRPVRLRCCLCQTQERGAAGNAELVHTLVLLVVHWCTLLEHSGAQSTRQHWRTLLCGSCLCGWREFPPLGARSLSHHLITATCHTERENAIFGRR